MYTNKIVRPRKAATEQDVREVEQKLGLRFPPDLFRHFVSFNGGQPSRDVFFLATDEGYQVHELIPIKATRDAGFEYIYKDLVLGDGLIPRYLIPFAVDPGGNFFCYSMRDLDKGGVVFYSMDHCDKPDLAEKFLARTLTSFFNDLVKD